MEKIDSIARKIKPETVLDAGCGEGMMIEKLAKKNVVGLPPSSRYSSGLRRGKGGFEGEKINFFGIDMSEEAIIEAKKRAAFAKLQVGSVYTLPFPENFFDLVLCSEVLEHLIDPEKALVELGRVSKKYLLLSVPNEPWFRISSFLSGKYLKTFGNHPEHVQNWSKKEFVKMVGKYFKVLEVETSFPWIIVLGEKN